MDNNEPTNINPAVKAVPTQAANPAPTEPAEPKKSNKTLIAILSILLVISLAAGAVFAYLYFNSLSNTNSNQPINESQSDAAFDDGASKQEYSVEDYVHTSDYTITTNCPASECNKSYTTNIVTKISFNNLPANVTADFEEKQKEFFDETYASGPIMSRENIVSYSIYKNYLSVYDWILYDCTYGRFGSYITLNVNLDTMEQVSKSTLTDLFDVDREEIYNKILNQLVNNVEIDEFLLDTNGFIDADKISVSDFTNNIPTYVNTLIENDSLFGVYIDNSNKLHAVYKQHEVLEALGMGSHMGIGLDPTVQDVEL